jgi:hypothetical protein
MLLFLSGSSCAAQLLHCLVSSSPTRWSNSVLSTACSQYPETISPIHHIYALGDWLFTAPPLSAFVPLPTFVSWYFGSLVVWIVTLLLLSAFVACLTFVCWDFGSLPQPHPLRLVQHSTQLPQFTAHAFQFCFWWGDQSAQGLCWIMVPRMDRGVACSACCSPVGFADLPRQLWNWLVGRNGIPLFSRQTLGLGSVQRGIGKLSMVYEYRMSQDLLLFWIKKIKKREKQKTLFHRADIPYCLWCAGIFLTVKCN